MSLSYCILGSGSSGNCLWVKGGGTQVLVDCGLSARQIGVRLEEVGGRLEDIAAILCTHGHSDHIGGARVLARSCAFELWATAGTASFLPTSLPEERIHALPYGGTLRLHGLTVETVPTSHDCPQSVALRLSDGETSLGVVTDLGVATDAIVNAFKNLDGLLLEMNHDVPMLLEGPYPERLKKRITSKWGHLSNEQGAEMLRAVLHDGLQQLSLGHLSEQNNTEDLARAAAEAILEERGGKGPALAVVVQHKVGEPVTLTPASAKKVPARLRQLALPLR